MLLETAMKYCLRNYICLSSSRATNRTHPGLGKETTGNRSEVAHVDAPHSSRPFMIPHNASISNRTCFLRTTGISTYTGPLGAISRLPRFHSEFASHATFGQERSAVIPRQLSYSARTGWEGNLAARSVCQENAWRTHWRQQGHVSRPTGNLWVKDQRPANYRFSKSIRIFSRARVTNLKSVSCSWGLPMVEPH